MTGRFQSKHLHERFCTAVLVHTYFAEQLRAVHLVIFWGELLHGDVVSEVVTQISLLLALLPLAACHGSPVPLSC